jgi:dGTP triphosphohydrolase
MTEKPPALTRRVSEERSILAYEFREADDRINGMKSSANPKLPFERYDADRHNDAFDVFASDVRAIEGSQLFRRLSKHSMVTPSTDPGFENRHSHSLSVANVAERIADGLKLGPASGKLTRAIALVHDIGHSPFSHEGEAILKEKLAGYGLDWDHDHVGLDILMQHAHKGISFKGMNLSVAVMEGAAKRYHKYIDEGEDRPPFVRHRDSLPESIRALDKQADLKLEQWNHLEGQIASTADWVTGLTGDIEDTLMLHLNNRIIGQSKSMQPFTEFFRDVAEKFPPAQKLYDEVKRDMRQFAVENGPGKLDKKDYANRVHSMVRSFISNLESVIVEDIIENTQRNIANHASEIVHAGDVRKLDSLVAVPSPEMVKHLDRLKDYFSQTLYPKIAREYLDTKKLVGIVFDDFMHSKVAMPNGWGKRFERLNAEEAAHQGDAGALKEIEKKKALLVAEYLTVNYSDRDVLWHMKQHHEHTFRSIADRAKPAPHITYPHHENSFHGRS